MRRPTRPDPAHCARLRGGCACRLGTAHAGRSSNPRAAKNGIAGPADPLSVAMPLAISRPAASVKSVSGRGADAGDSKSRVIEKGIQSFRGRPPTQPPKPRQSRKGLDFGWISRLPRPGGALGSMRAISSPARRGIRMLRLGLDHRDLAPTLDGRCGEFQADEAAADDDDPSRPVGIAVFGVPVHPRSSAVSSAPLATRDGRLSWFGAGREEQPLVRAAAPPSESRDGLSAAVDRHGRDCR